MALRGDWMAAKPRSVRVAGSLRSSQFLCFIGIGLRAQESRSEFLHPNDRKKAASELTALKRASSIAELVSRFRFGNGSYKLLRWRLSSDIDRRRICGIASSVSNGSMLENEEQCLEPYDLLREFPLRPQLGTFRSIF